MNPTLNNSVFQIDDTKQGAYFFVLPKSSGDVLYVSFPKVLNEAFHWWIEKKESKDLYLSADSKKYTFYGARVSSCVIGHNRYGKPSREIRISFDTMLLGFRRKDA